MKAVWNSGNRMWSMYDYQEIIYDPSMITRKSYTIFVWLPGHHKHHKWHLFEYQEIIYVFRLIKQGSNMIHYKSYKDHIWSLYGYQEVKHILVISGTMIYNTFNWISSTSLEGWTVNFEWYYLDISNFYVFYVNTLKTSKKSANLTLANVLKRVFMTNRVPTWIIGFETCLMNCFSLTPETS